jgi:hypothetical protein
MAQVPGSGSLSQVLKLLSKYALTPAYNTVLAETVANAAATKSVYTMHDRTNGRAVLATIDLAEEDPETGVLLDASWADTGFAQSMIAETLKLAAPFPAIEIIGAPGNYMRGAEGDMEDSGYAVVNHVVDAVVFAGGDQQVVVQRKALLLAEAFRHLIRKDDCLGGLVMQIRPRGPEEPGGGGRHKESAVVMAARIRFDVRVLWTP